VGGLAVGGERPFLVSQFNAHRRFLELDLGFQRARETPKGWFEQQGPAGLEDMAEGLPLWLPLGLCAPPTWLFIFSRRMELIFLRNSWISHLEVDRLGDIP
jgi:hypothetical protein